MSNGGTRSAASAMRARDAQRVQCAHETRSAAILYYILLYIVLHIIYIVLICRDDELPTSLFFLFLLNYI